MRQKSERHQGAAERTIKDIRRQTRKRYSSEEKIRIVLSGLRACITAGQRSSLKPGRSSWPVIRHERLILTK